MRSDQKTAMVGHFVCMQGNNWVWYVQQRRRLHEWEEPEFEELMELLQQQRPRMEREDVRVWRGGKEDFSVKSAYRVQEEILMQSTQNLANNFPVQKVWIPVVPSKVNIFIWAVMQGRTLTTDNLHKRKKIIPNRCIMCKQETRQHLFTDCLFADLVWWKLICGLTDRWISSVPINQWIRHRKRSKIFMIGRLIWKVIGHAIFWGIWCERNSRIFNETTHSFDQVIHAIIIIVWEWLNCKGQPGVCVWRTLFLIGSV